VTERRFQLYLEDISTEARRARRLYDLLVVPGAEITQNHIRSRKNSHIIALNIRGFISADQPAEDILRAIRAQGAFSIACHPHHRTTRRVEVATCYLWDHRKRLADLVDVSRRPSFVSSPWKSIRRSNPPIRASASRPRELRLDALEPRDGSAAVGVHERDDVGVGREARSLARHDQSFARLVEQADARDGARHGLVACLRRISST
jgi:hypothetical protein